MLGAACVPRFAFLFLDTAHVARTGWMVVLVVPEGTVEILAHAYSGREDIKEVRFPASLRHIRWVARRSFAPRTLRLARCLVAAGLVRRARVWGLRIPSARSTVAPHAGSADSTGCVPGPMRPQGMCV